MRWKLFIKPPVMFFRFGLRNAGRRVNLRILFMALLTILVHSRFDQGNQSIKALENTQKLFRLIVQPNLLLDEIPPLEGTSFASGEVWRDLFQRALPKVHQIGNAILEKNKWNALI